MDINQKFKIYLAAKKMTLKKFSELVGKNSTYLSSVMNGRIFPGKKLIDKIEEVTERKIKFLDFMRCKKIKNKELHGNQDEEEEQKG
jgi:transcriptional regulator with XRE-family HTH domain